MAVDHKDRWIFGHRLEEDVQDVSENDCKDVIRSYVNKQDIDIKLISHSIWEMAALNAERYRDARVFLVGDAAHRMPPTGGMGMNTGFAGAQNLAWKLAYVLKGYAEPSFLNSYEAERKPVASYTLEWSGRNAKRMFSMLEAYREGEIDLFNELMADQTHHINHPGLDIGMVYRSDAIYSDNTDAFNFDPESYFPSSMPGMASPTLRGDI